MLDWTAGSESVEAFGALTLKERLLRDLILYNKEIRMKLKKKDIVVSGEFMD